MEDYKEKYKFTPREFPFWGVEAELRYIEKQEKIIEQKEKESKPNLLSRIFFHIAHALDKNISNYQL